MKLIKDDKKCYILKLEGIDINEKKRELVKSLVYIWWLVGMIPIYQENLWNKTIQPFFFWLVFSSCRIEFLESSQELIEKGKPSKFVKLQ